MDRDTSAIDHSCYAWMPNQEKNARQENCKNYYTLKQRWNEILQPQYYLQLLNSTLVKSKPGHFYQHYKNFLKVFFKNLLFGSLLFYSFFWTVWNFSILLPLLKGWYLLTLYSFRICFHSSISFVGEENIPVGVEILRIFLLLLFFFSSFSPVIQ